MAVTARMAQSVVYADLKFAAALPSADPACHADLDEADSPYENVPLGQVPSAPSPGRWPQHWRIPVGLLAATLLLLLLLLVATIALGACYWQVTRRLQDTSREHAAEQGRLLQELSTQEQSLEQTRLELALARVELQQAWQEGNSSQLELGNRDAELEHAREELALLEKELRASKSNVSSLRACVNTECCPSDWVLYRSKCLFISVEKKTWTDSRDDCRRKNAKLLVQDNWPLWTVPHFVQAGEATYWIGAVFFPDKRRTLAWQNGELAYTSFTYCAQTTNGRIESSYCRKKNQWICEQLPKLSQASETLLPLLVEG